jgi:hypothetical protein
LKFELSVLIDTDDGVDNNNDDDQGPQRVKSLLLVRGRRMASTGLKSGVGGKRKGT